jgi:hypothetical protein
MLTNINLPGGIIAHGYQVVGSPVDTTGKVFYVSSTADNCQDDPSHGGPDRPFATWAYAATRTRANKGDVIILMPGHAEAVTAAAGLALATAGVTHYGLGHGASRPTITFTTVVGASLVASAASQTIVNVLFVGGIDALTGCVGIQAADCRLIGCETRDGTSTQATVFILTSAAADRMLISGWVHRGAAAAGAEAAIRIVGGDGITVENFWVDGNFSVAAIENVTTAGTNFTIGGGSRVNYVRTRNAADIAITLVATTTGNVGPSIMVRLQDNAANVTECIVAAAAQIFGPILIVNADGEQGLAFNGTATIDI